MAMQAAGHRSTVNGSVVGEAVACECGPRTESQGGATAQAKGWRSPDDDDGTGPRGPCGRPLGSRQPPLGPRVAMTARASFEGGRSTGSWQPPAGPRAMTAREPRPPPEFDLSAGRWKPQVAPREATGGGFSSSMEAGTGFETGSSSGWRTQKGGPLALGRVHQLLRQRQSDRVAKECLTSPRPRYDRGSAHELGAGAGPEVIFGAGTATP